MIYTITVMLLMRNSVESSLTGVSPSASEAAYSLWMCYSAISESAKWCSLKLGIIVQNYRQTFHWEAY
jgi:hypothetical protein